MTLQLSGAISFTDIQTIFGGTNPIGINEYYTNDASGFTTGVSGLPSTGSAISLQQFYGKAKDRPLSLTTLQTIYSGLQPYLAEYKNANFYEYTLDGTSEYIGDGTNDMYDDGNYTQIMADGAVSGNLSYSTTTETSVVVNAKSTGYISLGHARPLIMLAKSTTRASWGFQKSGNLGADGTGSYNNFNVYTGSIVNGFTVYAWCRHVYNAGDPSIADLYFAIGDSSSTFYTSTMTVYGPSDTNSGLSSMSIDCVNVLFGCMLCSKPSGTSISAGECQTVLTSLINRLRPIIVSQSLYSFTAHTFTNAGATGFSGPILSQVRSAYSGAAWAQNNSYLNMTTQGIQEWTVPATGSYTIRVAGAKGGDAKGYTGGSGRTVDATFTLTQNQVIKILIGQSGLSATSSVSNVGGGGGGGSFVINKTDNSILLIAGGGGGAKDNTSSGYTTYSNGVTAPYTNAGTLPSGGTGSTSGNGGGAYQGNWSGGGGGGFSGNGGLSPYGSTVGTDGSFQSIVAGISFTNGGLGGKGWTGNGYTNTGTAHGGFGGGGGCVNDGPFYPGGGGGYSGGDGTDYSTNVGGGGGGYYSNGTNTTNIGTNASNGYVTITRV